jgi:trimeric autotransporter adhesin
LEGLTISGLLKFNSLTTAPVDADTYIIGTSGISATSDNYDFALNNAANNAYRITPHGIVLIPEAVSKVYDGSLAYNGDLLPNLASLTAQLGIAGAEVTGASLAYTDKNVGLGNKTISLSSLSINGAPVSRSNYDLVYGMNHSSSITPRSLVLTGLQLADKVYDGSRSAVVSYPGSFSGLIPGDQLSLPPVLNEGFPSRNVGTYYITSLPSGSLLGNDASNYQLVSVSVLGRPQITPRPLVLSVADEELEYGELPNEPISIRGLSLGDRIDGLSPEVIGSGNPRDPNCCSIGVRSGYSIEDGNYGGNYQVAMIMQGRAQIHARLVGGNVVGKAIDSATVEGVEELEGGAEQKAKDGGFANGRNASDENRHDSIYHGDSAKWQVTDKKGGRRAQLRCSIFVGGACGRELDMKYFGAKSRSYQAPVVTRGPADRL